MSKITYKNFPKKEILMSFLTYGSFLKRKYLTLLTDQLSKLSSISYFLIFYNHFLPSKNFPKWNFFGIFCHQNFSQKGNFSIIFPIKTFPKKEIFDISVHQSSFLKRKYLTLLSINLLSQKGNSIMLI